MDCTYSADIRAFLVADFKDEREFGIRSIPASLGQSFGTCQFALIIHVPVELNNEAVSINDISFHGTNKGVRDYGRAGSNNVFESVSLDTESQPSPKISKIKRSSSAEALTSLNHSVIDGSKPLTRQGVVRQAIALNTSR